MIEGFEFIDDPRSPAGYERDAKRLIGISEGAMLSSLRLERGILRRKLWQQLGTRPETHHVRFLAHLLPSLVLDPWFQLRVWSFYDTRKLGRQITNWWGCQNAGKTKSIGAMAVGFGVLHPEFTRQIVSGPFKDAGDNEAWGAVVECFDEAAKEHGADLASADVLMLKTDSKFQLRFSRTPRAGTITLRAIDDVGKIQGGKAKDREQEDGYLIYWLDEISLWEGNLAFLSALPNVKSNLNFHGITACNPKNPEGELDGELGRPDRGGWGAIDMNRDWVWNSMYGSRTYRFDGLQSPNFAHKNRWPWLFNARREQTLRDDYGANSDKYNEQCRAFVTGGTGGKTCLTLQDMTSGLVEADYAWALQAEKWRVGFLDASFSSQGDDSVFSVIEGGMRREPSGMEFPLVTLKKQIQLQVTTGLEANQEWLNRVRDIRKSREAGLVIGQTISVERQIAIQAAELCNVEDILFRDFGYDDSMRGRLMEAFQWAMGDQPMIVSYVGEPDDDPMWPAKWVKTDDRGNQRLKTWREECQKFVSAIWFQGCAIVRSGMFRCPRAHMRWYEQARRRRWKEGQGGRKRDVESKAEYKERPPRESPDYADSFFGALHVAVKRGYLRLTVDKPLPQSNNGRGLFNPRNAPKRHVASGLYGSGSRR